MLLNPSALAGLLIIAAVAITACNGTKDATMSPTATVAATSTPTPLYSLDEARELVQQFGARDPNVPSDATQPNTYVNCGGASNVESNGDRYVAERRTWVLHCSWEVIDVPGIETATAAGRTPPSIYSILKKTYILDDITGAIRE